MLLDHQGAYNPEITAVLPNPPQPKEFRFVALCVLPQALCPKPVFCAASETGVRVYFHVSEGRLRCTAVRATGGEVCVRDASVIGSSCILLGDYQVTALCRQQLQPARYVESMQMVLEAEAPVHAIAAIPAGTVALRHRNDGSALLYAGVGGALESETEKEPSFLILTSSGVTRLRRRDVRDTCVQVLPGRAGDP